jgi:hypothetical protein
MRAYILVSVLSSTVTTAVIFALSTVIGSPAPANAQAGVVRATRFELVDASGRVRAELKMDGTEGPAFNMSFGNGRYGVTLTSYDTLGFGALNLGIPDRDSLSQVTVAADSVNRPVAENSGWIELRTREGVTIWRAPTDFPDPQRPPGL